jgi:osmotically-inducible protein OsmY
MKTSAFILIAPLTLLAFGSASAAGAQVVDKTKTAAVKSKDAVVKAAKVTADKTEDAVSKTGEVMTDAWIETRIHGRFVDEALLKDSDIKVKSSKHVVTLTGTVISGAGRAKATTVARGTEGVRRVVNRLTVGPKAKA